MNKVVFMGTPQFSVPILEAIIQDQTIELIAVVTQPDRKVGRKQRLTASPIKKLALKHDIEVLQPEKISGSPEMEQIIEMKPDLIITTAYGQFVPTKLLHAPTYRSINVHASLLPKYRGAAPIHYAILNGDEETGITIMYMEKVMDAGDIISQKSIVITDEDTTGSMFEKLSILGRDLLMETLPSIFSEENESIKQDEDKVTYSPMISKEQEKIDWNKSAREIFNHIRALNPAPGAYTLLDDQRFKIWEAETTVEKTDKKPGQIVKATQDALYVAGGDGGVLSLVEVQPAGRQRLSVEDYLIGATIDENDKFTT